MMAHTTIVFTRYIMLAFESRCGKDQRTLGNLFYVCCDELKDLCFIETFHRILTVLQNILYEQLAFS